MTITVAAHYSGHTHYHGWNISGLDFYFFNGQCLSIPLSKRDGTKLFRQEFPLESMRSTFNLKATVVKPNHKPKDDEHGEKVVLALDIPLYLKPGAQITINVKHSGEQFKEQVAVKLSTRV